MGLSLRRPSTFVHCRFRVSSLLLKNAATMAAHGNISRPLQAFDAPLSAKRDARRDPRIRYRAPFYLLWDEQSCQPKYSKAVSNDVSERGLSLEIPQSIPVGTRISLRAESEALLGSAMVKHAARDGSVFVIGVEFGYSLLDDAHVLVREVYSTPRAKQASF